MLYSPMGNADNLNYRFPSGSETVPLADAPLFGDEAAFAAGHEALLERFLGALAACGVTDFDTKIGDFRTGGHADIHYRAARYGDDDGGAEVVLHQVSWGGGYEAVSPWVVLFGSWTAHAEALSAFRDAPA